MTEDIKKLLDAEGENPFHLALLDHANKLVKMSRAKMSQHYAAWDLHDRVYRGETIPDIESKRHLRYR